MNITPGELQILEKLFTQRTGRTLDAAVAEVCRIAMDRAKKDTVAPPRRSRDRLAETLAE